MKVVVAILIGIFLIVAAVVILVRSSGRRRDRRQRRERRRRWLADRYIWDVVMRRNTSRRLTYRGRDEGDR